MAVVHGGPCTPPRPRRSLEQSVSDPKLRFNKLRRVTGADDGGPTKPSDPLPLPVTVPVFPASVAALPTIAGADADMTDLLDRHGVPASGRNRLAPLLHRWGRARSAQVFSLWSLLGDGAQRPTATSGLQVWGPAGAGKSGLVGDFLGSLGFRHIRLNCVCFASVGELLGRLDEEMRRCALQAAKDAGDDSPPKELLQRPAVGHQVRAFDRMDATLQVPLEYMARLSGGGKVVIVFDNCQELSRFGSSAIELLITLPEVLRRGEQMVVLSIGRLPLSCLGVPPGQEPPAVAFQAYTAQEAGDLLYGALSATVVKEGRTIEATEIRSLTDQVLKFAAPFLGNDLHQLVRVGLEVLETPEAPSGNKKSGSAGAAWVASMLQRIEEAVQRRLALCDLSGLLTSGAQASEGVASPPPNGITASVAATAVTMQDMTKAEKRLIVAAYLGAHIDKDDDQQLFLPRGGKKKIRHGSVLHKKKGVDQNLPAFVQAPKPVPLARLLAIYHTLARQPQLVSVTLLEHVMNLREVGMLRFTKKDKAAVTDREPSLVCRAELSLVRACASELDIDLAEYLCKQ